VLPVCVPKTIGKRYEVWGDAVTFSAKPSDAWPDDRVTLMTDEKTWTRWGRTGEAPRHQSSAPALPGESRSRDQDRP
jgi:hypothetical protein